METNGNETKQIDPMIAAFFQGDSQEEQIQEEVKEELVEEVKEEVKEEIKEEIIVSEVKEEIQEEVKEAFVLDEKSKWVIDKLAKGEDKDVYELLKGKYAYDNLSDEAKIMTYLAEKNPHLNSEDLAFKAAEEYGIGVTDIDDPELMDDATKKALRTQEIAKKGLLSEASQYFEDKVKSVEIPSMPNVLDLDEGYKEYVSYKAQQEQLQKEQEAQLLLDQQEEQKLVVKINDTAKQIEALPIELDIDLDQGKFDLKSEFKLDEAKQKLLADYAMEYTPTKAEYKAHQDQNGELDMKGYMTWLANKLFEPQIRKAIVKQSLAKDRENFINNELKVSTLNNSGDLAVTPTDIPWEVAAMSAGR